MGEIPDFIRVLIFFSLNLKKIILCEVIIMQINCVVQAFSNFCSKLHSFEQREIQPNERDVDVEFFSHLLIFYMIKEDWAKVCFFLNSI